MSVILAEIVYGGYLLSLGAVSILIASSLVLGLTISWEYLIPVFLGIHSAYLYNYYKEFKKDQIVKSKRRAYLKRYIGYVPFMVWGSLIIALIILIYSQKKSLFLIGSLLIVLSLLYSVFLKKLTKNIVAFKNIFVALMWASLLFFLTAYHNFSANNTAVLLIFCFVWLRSLMYEIFSDINDIKSDEKEKLLTIPILQKKNVKNILLILNLISVLPLILGIYLGILPIYSIALLLMIIYAFIYLLIPKMKIIAEGEYIIWSILVFSSKVLYEYFFV